MPLFSFDNSESLADWYKDEGDQLLLLNYPLDQNSVVFDVGGYLGDWSAKIAQRYGCTIFIFEPVLEFYRQLVSRFTSSPRVRIYPFGLSSVDAILNISRNGDESSLHRFGYEQEKAEFKNVTNFMPSTIDLLNINCEGGEFALLSSLIESGHIESCRNIQVQFHADYPDGVRLRDDLRQQLAKTHWEVYNYPFVWESWKKKED